MDASLDYAIRTLVTTSSDLGLTDAFSPAEASLLGLMREELDLPSELVDWYSEAEPNKFEIPRPAENIRLWGVAHLRDSLDGYSYASHAKSEVKLVAWDSSWLVIGGEGEYPIIMKRQQTNDQSVYFGRAVGGKWHLTILSEHLAGFLLGISGYLQLYLGQYDQKIYKGRLMDKDYDLDPDFVSAFSSILDRNWATKGHANVWLRDWLGL